MLLPSTPSDSWHALFPGPIHRTPIVQPLVTTLIYALVLSAAAWWLLTRRDFAGAAATSASQRRTTLRIGVSLMGTHRGTRRHQRRRAHGPDLRGDE